MNNSIKNKIPDFEYQTLTSISPSQFISIQKCAFQQVLQKSLKEPLLPSAPAAYLGKIIHKILELNAKGKVKNEADFQKHWANLVEKEEAKLLENGWSKYLPLRENTPYFALKKYQTKRALLKQKPISKTIRKYSSEKWLQSKDGKIKGCIDLVLEGEEIQLVDFKTGKILDEKTGLLKDAYQTQLKLYAYLFSKNFGKFPDRLWVSDLENNWEEVSFSVEECLALAAEAKQLLKEINDAIFDENFEKLANPNWSHCQFCAYRPACSFHWSLTKNENSFLVDLRGQIIDIQEVKDEFLNIKIKDQNGDFLILNVNKEDFNYLVGDEIRCFNLRKIKNSNTYNTLKNTLFTV